MNATVILALAIGLAANTAIGVNSGAGFTRPAPGQAALAIQRGQSEPHNTMLPRLGVSPIETHRIAPASPPLDCAFCTGHDGGVGAKPD